MIQSPRQLVTGILFRMPHTVIRQYLQGHIGGYNYIEEKRNIYLLYIGRASNGSGHWVFELGTKQAVSVNRVSIVSMSNDFQQRVNKLEEQDRQPDGIQISNAEGSLTILNFLEDASDNNKNESDEIFKHDNGYQKEFDDQLKQEKIFMKTLTKKGDE